MTSRADYMRENRHRWECSWREDISEPIRTVDQPYGTDPEGLRGRALCHLQDGGRGWYPGARQETGSIWAERLA